MLALTGSHDDVFGQHPTNTVTPGAPAASERDGGYQPWGREHANMDDVIEVRLKTGEWEQVYRPFLVRVSGVGDSLLSLFCTSCVITIHGSGLGELRQLVRTRAVDFIQEYNPAHWPKPGKGAPIIEHIEIAQGRGPRSAAEIAGGR